MLLNFNPKIRLISYGQTIGMPSADSIKSGGMRKIKEC